MRKTALALFGLLVAVRSSAQPASDAGVVRFTYADTTAHAVALAGEFNSWSPTATPLDREGGAWVTRVFLDPGTYQYKFQVDGVWKVDPRNPELSPQGNSVVRVGKDGSVEPPHPTPAAATAGGANPASESLSWSVRYLGFVTALRDPDTGRWDLARPLQDIDLRLDARMTADAGGYFLAHFDNFDTGATDALRYDRGELYWTPTPWALRLFDHVATGNFDDPGVLVGRVGRYTDEFGYERRGFDLRRRILGAPLELVYADDTEPGVNRAPATALPELSGSSGTALAGTSLERYVVSGSDRGADALGFRSRVGTARFGAGFSFRVDRGAQAGRVAQARITRTPGDTLVGVGREFETTETWSAWGIDLRTRWRAARFAAEYLTGVQRARATAVAPIVRWRAGPGDTVTTRVLGPPVASEEGFDLDHSRRVIVRAGGAAATQTVGAEIWSARPGTGILSGPRLSYEYEEHDFSALPTGSPFLMRRNSVAGGADGRSFGVTWRVDAEQHWFDYPSGADWQTQFWLRAGNFWLDEDVVGVDRLTLLGTPHAALLQLHAEGLLWPSRAWKGELHLTYSAPGFDRAPRLFESIAHVEVPLGGAFSLRAHARLPVYRRIEPIDAAGTARLGPGARIEAGAIDLSGITVDTSYRAFSNHFIEIVYALTSRSDIALGWGVDPFIVYEKTNEYAPIGWDEFVFDHGGNAALADPENFGHDLEGAERALERERRLGIEARLRF